MTRVSNVYTRSFLYLILDTHSPHYETQPIGFVKANNSCLLWESYQLTYTLLEKTTKLFSLKHVLHIITTKI